MQYPLTDMQADFETNRPIRYQVTAKRNYLHIRTDGRTDGQMSRTTTIGSFFWKKEKTIKICRYIYGVAHKKMECHDLQTLHWHYKICVYITNTVVTIL